MKVRAKAGREDIATVYMAEGSNGRHIEFVESVQPPIPRERKWVLIVSTLYGCPCRCRFCDAADSYRGRLSADEMAAQIDYMVAGRFPDRIVPVEKFKIQFARMGEPSYNEAVLDILESLPGRYDAPGLMPAISTIAPEGKCRFFDRLLDIKRELYAESFQIQFSVHTTDRRMRDWLIPTPKWSLERIARYGERIYGGGGRKVSLNFALAERMPVSAEELLRHFDPSVFIVKITPVNPTGRARESGVRGLPLPGEEGERIISSLEEAGYRVVLSIGELEENHIGSNCGQLIGNYLGGKTRIEAGYSYEIEELHAGPG